MSTNQLKFDQDLAQAQFPHLYENLHDTQPDFRKIGDYNTHNCCWVRQSGSGAILSCDPSTPRAFQVYYGNTEWVMVGDANTDDLVKEKLVELGWMPPETVTQNELLAEVLENSLISLEAEVKKYKKALEWVYRNSGAHSSNIRAVVAEAIEVPAWR